MTVEDLINELKNFNPNTEVVIQDHNRDRGYPTNLGEGFVILLETPYFAGDEPNVKGPYVTLRFW